MRKELIDIRICSELLLKKGGDWRHWGDFYFYRYVGDINLDGEKNPRWDRSAQVEGLGDCYEDARFGWSSLESVASHLLSFKKYARFLSPEYKIRLWEGETPQLRRPFEVLTEIPDKSVAEELPRILENYYEIKKMFIDREYEKVFRMLNKSDDHITRPFFRAIDDESFIQFYIALRKKDKKMAEKLVPTWSYPLYYELETEYLHRLEGRHPKKRLEARKRITELEESEEILSERE